MIYSTKELSQKLERTEARSNADFVDTRKHIEPDTTVEWVAIAGAYCMFDGAESPLTQTFGLGLFEHTGADDMDKIEAFFAKHGAETFHEVSPMADPALLTLLGERGYRPIELTTVMFQELDANDQLRVAKNQDIKTRMIGPDEADMWAAVAAEGWSTEMPEIKDFLLGLGKVAARTKGCRSFIAELDGKPIATGGFNVYDDVCVLAGASTIESGRNLGAQNALVAARLNYGAANGCKYAMMCAAPGSQSQVNAEKNGFKIAYTRTKWQLFK
jgi:hypothetical protein